MVLAHNIEEGCRTRDVQISQDVTFDSMLLSTNTLQGLKKSGFFKPSPVQLHGIPLGKCGFDLLLEAKSGTGKTAVFSVIVLEKLELEKGLQAVILAPTREIAYQICDVIKIIGSSYKGLVVEVVMGGLPVVDDVNKFQKNVHIVVGSPGRLRHLIQDKHINVSSVRLLVLDEADKLMEKSFLPDINYIFSVLPNQKQVIMCSATYPDITKTFINKYVKCAQHVCPESNCVLLGVEQKITVVKSNTNVVRQTQFRFEELLKILSKWQFKQCLIFCNYQARVYELSKLLNKSKWPVEQLCGKQDQSDRLDALKTLQEYKCRILVSTDLAARGIDASNVDLVINFEPPLEWQTYLHRIGRAGRYGSYGMAITILGEGKEENSFKNMVKKINLDTFKISNVWDSQENGVYETATVTHESSIVSKNNILTSELGVTIQEIWSELISDLASFKIEVDNFSNLCKSYEEAKLPEIQSFTDLIKSYETTDRKVLDCSEYQNIKILTSTSNIQTVLKNIANCNYNIPHFNNNFSGLQSSDKSKKHKDNVHNTTPISIELRHNRNNETQHNDTNSNKIDSDKKMEHHNIDLQQELNGYQQNKCLTSFFSNNSNKKEVKLPDSTTFCDTASCISENTWNVNHNYKFRSVKYKNEHTASISYDNDFQEDSSSKALLDAGLPLSFGSKKHKMYKDRREINKKSVEPIINVSEQNENITNHKITNTNNSKFDVSQDYSSTTSIEKKYDCTEYNKRNQCTKKKLANKLGYRKRESRKAVNYDHKETNHSYTQEYLNWYQKLKSQIKQIELAVYIDEMTKIQYMS